MFTGIITHTGKVVKKTTSRLTIKTDTSLLNQLNTGMSISVNGICLTIISSDEKSFSIDFMPETAKKTNIQYLQKDELVNLELPATATTFLSGHIMQGHVDTLAKITNIEKKGNSHIFTLGIPQKIGKYIVEKGSIAINGISLTVIKVTNSYFTVGIIPHTWSNTMLHTALVGDNVNLEVDIVAKYVEKLMSKSD